MAQWMFFDAEAFNGDVSKWDVSSVTTMQVRRPRLRSAWVVRAGRRVGAGGWGGSGLGVAGRRVVLLTRWWWRGCCRRPCSLARRRSTSRIMLLGSMIVSPLTDAASSNKLFGPSQYQVIFARPRASPDPSFTYCSNAH